ncbi:MAG: hypothetical protein P1V19_08710 [Gimesia sp.]|nr:hypothetical protein [Gimesia sp.]
MKANWSKCRITVWCIVLVVTLVLIPHSLLEYSRGDIGLTLFCLFAAVCISVVGIIDTCVLIFRGVWDQVTSGFFFNTFVINLSLFALMWLFSVPGLLSQF